MEQTPVNATKMPSGRIIFFTLGSKNYKKRTAVNTFFFNQAMPPANQAVAQKKKYIPIVQFARMHYTSCR